MKKSVLLGIVAVALFSLPALAGEEKWEGGWPGHWVWDWQDTGITIKVKMVIPWYIHIKNQDDIWLEQIQCGDKFPCFEGCNNSDVECNFNVTLACNISATGVVPGNWSCSINPSDIDAPGGNTTICAKVKKADLVGPAAQSEQHVANITIKVKPRV